MKHWLSKVGIATFYGVMAFLITLMTLFTALTVYALIMHKQPRIERIDNTLSREWIDDQWYYTYNDGLTKCTWADRIDLVCTRVE